MTILTADEIHGYPDIEENGTSFEENADIKAREASAYADMPAFADAADHDLSSVVQDFDAEPDQLRKLLAEVLLEIEKSVNFDLHRFCGGLQNKFRIHFKSFPDDKFPETIYNDFEI